MSDHDYKNIAAQLRQPEGEDGLKTAGYMAQNNRNMIERTIATLDLQTGHSVLEIGYGGGRHLPYLMGQAGNLHYTGIDISETMREAATESNAGTDGDFRFLQADARDGYVLMPFGEHTFDRVFTVNTVYFWDNALAQAKELLRVLKPGGLLSITFASRSFMQDLPFTAFGFQLYEPGDVATLMEDAGGKILELVDEQEIVPGINGDGLKRDFTILKINR